MAFFAVGSKLKHAHGIWGAIAGGLASGIAGSAVSSMFGGGGGGGGGGSQVDPTGGFGSLQGQDAAARSKALDLYSADLAARRNQMLQERPIDTPWYTVSYVPQSTYSSMMPSQESGLLGLSARFGDLTGKDRVTGARALSDYGKKHGIANTGNIYENAAQTAARIQDISPFAMSLSGVGGRGGGGGSTGKGYYTYRGDPSIGPAGVDPRSKSYSYDLLHGIEKKGELGETQEKWWLNFLKQRRMEGMLPDFKPSVQQVRLKPELQKALDLQNQVRLSSLQKQADLISGLSLAGMGGAGQLTGGTGAGTLGAPPAASLYGDDFGLLPGISDTRLPALRDLDLTGMPTVAPYSGHSYADEIQSEIGPTPDLRFDLTPGTYQGEIDSFGDLRDISLTDFGRARGEVADVGDLIRTYDLSGMGDRPTLAGLADPDAARREAQDAYFNEAMRFLGPQQEAERRRVETQLENQGIFRGSEAYTKAIDNLTRRQQDQTEAVTRQALTEGADYYGKISGTDVQRYLAGLQGREQEFGERARMGEFEAARYLDALGEEFQRAQLSNQALAMDREQDLRRAAFEREGITGERGFAMDRASLANLAQRMDFEDQAASMAARNQAIAQQFAQQERAAAFANQAAAERQRLGIEATDAQTRTRMLAAQQLIDFQNQQRAIEQQRYQNMLAQEQSEMQRQQQVANLLAQEANYQQGLRAEDMQRQQQQMAMLQALMGSAPAMPEISVPSISPQTIGSGSQGTLADLYGDSASLAAAQQTAAGQRQASGLGGLLGLAGTIAGPLAGQYFKSVFNPSTQATTSPSSWLPPSSGAGGASWMPGVSAGYSPGASMIAQYTPSP